MLLSLRLTRRKETWHCPLPIYTYIDVYYRYNVVNSVPWDELSGKVNCVRDTKKWMEKAIFYI